MTIFVAERFFQRKSDAFEGAESYHRFDSRPRRQGAIAPRQSQAQFDSPALGQNHF